MGANRAETPHHNSAHKGNKHPILEFVHPGYETLMDVHRYASRVELGKLAVMSWSGAHAFREYNWLTMEPVKNISGNLRGMVISAKWRTAFNFLEESKAAQSLEKIGLVAGFTTALAEKHEEFETIFGSEDPAFLKGLQYAAIAGTAAEKALAGGARFGVHAIYRSLEGWCMIAGLLGARSSSAKAIETIDRADRYVKTAFDAITDTTNQAAALTAAAEQARWFVVHVVF
ncbi:MAG TPA: hypothetical protein VH639_06790 [Bryobacteraceae bacterium]|jgi:hypothetical protein